MTTYAQEVIEALDGRYSKRKHVNPNLGKPLSKAETDVLRMIAIGETNKSMAFLRQTSIKTIEKHRTHLMDKLDLRCIADLTHYALANGVCGNKFGGNK